jgi:hypothetical protein
MLEMDTLVPTHEQLALRSQLAAVHPHIEFFDTGTLRKSYESAFGPKEKPDTDSVRRICKSIPITAVGAQDSVLARFAVAVNRLPSDATAWLMT